MIFGIRVEYWDDSCEFYLANLRSNLSDNPVFNTFCRENIVKVVGNTFVFKIVYFQQFFYVMGFLGLTVVTLAFFHQFVLALMATAGLLLNMFIFSRLLLYFAFRVGLRKAGYQHKIKLLSSDKTLEVLFDCAKV